jgi:hypothetical protein
MATDTTKEQNASAAGYQEGIKSPASQAAAARQALQNSLQ